MANDEHVRLIKHGVAAWNAWRNENRTLDPAAPVDLFAPRFSSSAPPANGSRFTLMEFQPGNAAHLHRTDTVDYVICVTGEIDMFLDDAQFITLRAGDVLVQRGTYHAWANRSDKPCRIAVALLDALPKREGSISGLVSAR